MAFSGVWRCLLPELCPLQHPLYLSRKGVVCKILGRRDRDEQAFSKLQVQVHRMSRSRCCYAGQLSKIDDCWSRLVQTQSADLVDSNTAGEPLSFCLDSMSGLNSSARLVVPNTTDLKYLGTTLRLDKIDKRNGACSGMRPPCQPALPYPVGPRGLNLGGQVGVGDGGWGN